MQYIYSANSCPRHNIRHLLACSLISNQMFPPSSTSTRKKLYWGGPSNSLMNINNKSSISATTSLKLLSPSFWRKKKIIRQVVTASNTSSTRIAANDQRPDSKYNKELTQCSTNIDFHGGRLLQNGLVYRQNFFIRSFEVGGDHKISLAALMNYLQDTALEHGKSIGLSAAGFGSTPEMIKKDLIWVANSIKIAINRYPVWTDIVQIDTWYYASGKNGLGCDWLVIDGETAEILIRATSLYVMMNKRTRKLSKFLKEVKEEFATHLVDYVPVVHQDGGEMLHHIDIHTADYVCKGLKPGWNDMDLNQHVSHVKYIDWILESIPRWIMDSHEISAVILKYRRECNRDVVLQSLSKIIRNKIGHCSNAAADFINLEHMLCLENGLEVVRGKTIWRPMMHNDGNAEPKICRSSLAELA